MLEAFPVAPLEAGFPIQRMTVGVEPQTGVSKAKHAFAMGAPEATMACETEIVPLSVNPLSQLTADRNPLTVKRSASCGPTGLLELTRFKSNLFEFRCFLRRGLSNARFCF